MGVPLPEGRFLVLLHPNQTPERAAVTVMEEVAHAYFEHRPSRLVTERNGFARREYDKQIEQEAYWTAAAAMLPRLVVAHAVWRGQSAEDLATQYHVSVELAEFRIKVMRLWPERVGSPKARQRAS
jgi:Zn-dependent peptidase ImmA (M78 family)